MELLLSFALLFSSLDDVDSLELRTSSTFIRLTEEYESSELLVLESSSCDSSFVSFSLLDTLVLSWFDFSLSCVEMEESSWNSSSLFVDSLFNPGSNNSNSVSNVLDLKSVHLTFQLIIILLVFGLYSL